MRSHAPSTPDRDFEFLRIDPRHSRSEAHAFNTAWARSRQILVHGLLLVMTGLLLGFVVPLAPFPRLALGAHIQFITNGLLILVMAVLLLALPHRVGPKAAGVMLLSAWLIWPMALSEVANAWWGTLKTLPLAGGQAGAKGGAAWHEAIVKIAHVVAGLGLVAAWGLLVAGFMKKPATAE